MADRDFPPENATQPSTSSARPRAAATSLEHRHFHRALDKGLSSETIADAPRKNVWQVIRPPLAPEVINSAAAAIRVNMSIERRRFVRPRGARIYAFKKAS